MPEFQAEKGLTDILNTRIQVLFGVLEEEKRRNREEKSSKIEYFSVDRGPRIYTIIAELDIPPSGSVAGHSYSIYFLS